MDGAERYDRLVLPFLHPFTRALVRQAGELADAEVLDHGSGTGEVALALHRRWPAARVTALDPNSEMLHRLRAKAGQTAGWLATFEGTLSEAGFVNQFDLCVSQFALMIVSDPSAELRALRRATRAGGRLIASVPQGPETMVPFSAYWSAAQRVVKGAVAPIDYPHYRFADPADFRALAEAAGWADVTVYDLRATRQCGPTTVWRWLSGTLPIRMQDGTQMSASALSRPERRALREELLASLGAYLVGGVYRLPTAAWLLAGRT